MARTARTTGEHTLTTRELALPCSYARSAELTIGRWLTRETKSGASSSGSDGELERDVVDSAGVGWNAGPRGALSGATCAERGRGDSHVVGEACTLLRMSPSARTAMRTDSSWSSSAGCSCGLLSIMLAVHDGMHERRDVVVRRKPWLQKGSLSRINNFSRENRAFHVVVMQAMTQYN